MRGDEELRRKRRRVGGVFMGLREVFVFPELLTPWE
jgi:hypothetical protein